MIKRPDAPTSASEIALFRQCKRKWAAKYACDTWEEFRDPRVFALGTAYHGVAERYIRSGVIPQDPSDPLTEMLMCALPHLPEPGNFELLEVRENVTILTSQGPVPATVTADYVGRTPDAAVKIIDHKTSKDPTRYGVRTREEKLDDTQTVFYSHTYLRGTSGVWFDHIYIKKHKAAYAKYEGRVPNGAPVAPKAYPTNLFLHASEIDQAYATTVAEPAAELFQLRRKGERIDPMTLPPTPEACGAYGGCPHRDRCWPMGYLGASSTAAPEKPLTAGPRALTLREWLDKQKAST